MLLPNSPSQWSLSNAVPMSTANSNKHKQIQPPSAKKMQQQIVVTAPSKISISVAAHGNHQSYHLRVRLESLTNSSLVTSEK